MTEDEMMLLNQIKQQNEDLRRKSDSNGGCGRTILGIILIVIVLKYIAPDVLDYILYGAKGKPNTEQVDEDSNDDSNGSASEQTATNNSTANFYQQNSEPVNNSTISYNKNNSIAITNIQMYLPEDDGNVSVEIQAINTSKKNYQTS